MNRRGARVFAFCVFTFGYLACGPDVGLVDPGGGGDDNSTIVLIAENTDLAAQIGWEDGIPGVTVWLQRDSEPGAQSFRSDSIGRVQVPDLPGARYWIRAERQLDAAERAIVGNDVYVLGGGAFTTVSRGGELTIPMATNDPGSLVISEYYYHYPPTSLTGLPTYMAHMYIELYNNADTTVFLDGRIIGSGFNYSIDGSQWSCGETEPFRNEPRGVYAQYFQAFPGDGGQYPLAPGHAVVIADQAIDHSAFYAGLPDLRDADFEFAFPDRANNPTVPDMVDIGLKPLSVNRNTRFFSLHDVPFIAAPLNVASLERALPKYQGEFALFPAEAIIDLAAFTSTYYEVAGRTPLCSTQVDRSLDRISGMLPPDETQPDGHLLSVHRKQMPNGKLQRTHATYVDFEVAPRSPGQVP